LSRHRSIPKALVVLVAVTVFGLGAASAGAAPRPTAKDRKILAAGVIRAADVPVGWTSTAPRKRANDSFKGIAECKVIGATVATAKKTAPSNRSREFGQPGSSTIASADNTVYTFKSATVASKYLAAFQTPDAPTCVDKGLKVGLVNAVSSDVTTTISEITDLQGVGDDSIGYEDVATVNAATGAVTVYADFVAVRLGRVIVGYTFLNSDAQLPDGPAIVGATLTRVLKAGA
jgi:hypothetical protein